MKTCTQEITLYVDRKNKYKYVYGKQSDTKSRFLKVTIVDGGKKVVLGRDDNAKFRALKPDGTAVFNDCVIEPDGTILVELSAQTLAVEGQVSADVVIIGKSDEILATANFCIIVEKAPVGKDVESSNEFLALVEAMNQAVKKDQGKENSGKVLAVGDDGIVVPAEIKVGDNSLVVSATINGDYQVVSCDTTFDDIDKAYAAGSSMLMKASIADSSITVIAPFMQKTDSNDYIFAFDDGSVIHAIAIGESGTWTTTDVQIDANKIPYELSEDFLANFPDFELESDTVKSGLDFAMYYAVAGMFAKNIGCDVPTATGTTTVELQSVLDGFVFPAMMKAHEHGNKSVLDKFDESKDGKPTYSGKEIGGAGDFIIKMMVTSDDNGKYTVTSCSTTVEQIDAAVADEKRVVVIATDTDNNLSWDIPIVQGFNGSNYYFATFLLGQAILSFVQKTGENQARWQFIVGQIGADFIGYSNDALPNMSTVGEALDELVKKSGHTHTNKDVLDKLSDSNGKLQYNGSNISVTKNGVISALGYTPQAVSTKVSTGSNIALADNTEYRLTDVTTLTLTYPTGDFECWMRLTFAASGDITVTLPTTTQYIGTTPAFANGETWELSIKDGVVIAQKVGEGA